MTLFPFVLAFALFFSQQAPSAYSQQGTTVSADRALAEQRARQAYERHRQAAIEINDLARQIHSEVDANALVDKIAEIFADTLPPSWVTQGIRQRIAHAEYEAVSDPSLLIPEQRVADVWNKYVREIGASNEGLVTAAELHNLRDADFAAAQLLWSRGQNIWTVPNIYALGPDGKVAEGSRPLEALRILYDLDQMFDNLRAARERVRKGVFVSDELKKRLENPPPKRGSFVRLEGRVDTNPIRLAEQRYLQEHGPYTLDGVLAELFDELFPSSD